MTNSIFILIGGSLSFALAVFHAFFYSYFKWRIDLKNVSIVNEKIIMTLHIGVIAIFLFFAFLSLTFTEELGQCNGLAGSITGFYAFVWLWRVIWQVVYLKEMKKEKPVLHYALIVWFLMLFAAYSIPVIAKLS